MRLMDSAGSQDFLAMETGFVMGRFLSRPRRKTSHDL